MESPSIDKSKTQTSDYISKSTIESSNKNDTSLDSLLNAQSSEGYWSSQEILKAFLSSIEDDSLLVELMTIITDEAQLKKALMTILALYILKEKFSDK